MIKSKELRIESLIRKVTSTKTLKLEVRLPKGYFTASHDFSFKDPTGEWTIPFYYGDIIYLNPEHKIIKAWNKNTNTWISKDLSFKDLIKPDIYRIFSTNTIKMNPADVENKIVAHTTTTEFKTTVGSFASRVKALKLGPDTKIRVVVIEE